MDFFIQASNPKVLINAYDIQDTNVSEAIETVFPLYTEDAILNWNHIPVPLSYKYDISYMIDDIVSLIKNIRSNNEGKLKIIWLPDTFRTDWDIKWSKGTIGIVSHWENTVGDLQNLLNENSSIELPIDMFINEWKKVFEIIINGLKINGYDDKKLTDFSDLVDIFNNISVYGVLYNVV